MSAADLGELWEHWASRMMWTTRGRVDPATDGTYIWGGPGWAVRDSVESGPIEFEFRQSRRNSDRYHS